MHDREHHGEADELGRDDRERHELAREAHFADQVRVLEQAPGRRLERGREEDPHRQAGEQEEPVVLVVRGLDLQHHAEDEQVDEHQHDRVGERPRRARAPSPCTSHAGRGGRGCRRARGSGRGRRRPSRSPTSVGRVPAHTALTGLLYAFRSVSAIVTLAALPVAALVLWRCLRSPTSASGSSPSRRASAGTRRATPALRRRRHLRRLRDGRAAAVAVGAVDAVFGAARNPRRLHAPLPGRLRRRPLLAPPVDRSSRPSSRPRGSCWRAGCRSRSSTRTCSRRCSGSSGSSGSRTPSTCSTTWTGSPPRSPTVSCAVFAVARRRADAGRATSCSSLALALGARLPRLPALQPSLRPAGGRCSWATPAAR